MSEIADKLRKLLVLARRGVDGERENAQSRLEALMKRHGVVLADLEDEAREDRWFKHEAGVFERKLMVQVIASVCGQRSVWTSRGRRNALCVEATKEEALEIELLYAAYVVALKAAMSTCFTAFIHTNDIFDSGAGAKADGSDVDMAEIRKIALAMLGMERVKVRRVLGCVGGTSES